MKYLIILLFLVFTSCSKSFFQSQIGNEIKNGYEINIDTSKLKLEWNKLIFANNIDGKVTNFEIKSDTDHGTGKKYYYLFSKSKNNELKMATKLLKKNKKFYIDNQELRFVICHGCNDSYPRIYNNSWSCETDNLFECKKTEVVKF